MTVEMAVVTPVVLVVALALANLMWFVLLCARFDQVALDEVVAHGVAPMGAAGADAAAREVEGAIREAMGEARCDVAVEATRLRDEPEASFATAPLLVRFTCRMTYRPVPSGTNVAGVDLGAPLELAHERELVVDVYRGGVVV